MRIAQVIPSLAVAAGPTTFCVKVADELAKTGCDVDLYASKLGNVCLRPQTPGVKVIAFGKALHPVCVPDLIHVHALWGMASHRGCTYARKNKIPYMVSAHGMLAPWALKHKWLKKKIAWRLYQKRDLEGAAMFHVTAECEIKWLRDLGFRQPCVLAPLGSDLPDLDFAESQRCQDVKSALFLGRIYPVKGLMNLVRAWARLKENVNHPSLNGTVKTVAGPGTDCGSRLSVNGTPWQLVIAGPDQAGHKAALVAEAKRLGLRVEDTSVNAFMRSCVNMDGKVAENEVLGPSGPQSFFPDIFFTGSAYGEEKDALYRRADLFVLPSFTENFGVVVTDALAYRVPVITTKGTPWAELENCGNMFMRECVNGKTVPDENKAITQCGNQTIPPVRAGWWIDIGVEPLATALKEAMSLSEENRLLMGSNGRQLVEMKYTWPAIAAEMKQTYTRILNH